MKNTNISGTAKQPQSTNEYEQIKFWSASCALDMLTYNNIINADSFDYNSNYVGNYYKQ